MGVVTLTITLSDPLAKFLVCVPENLYSAGLEVLVPKQGIIPPRNMTMIILNRR